MRPSVYGIRVEKEFLQQSQKSKKGWADNSLKWRASTEDKGWKSSCNSQLVEDTPNPCNQKDDDQQLLEAVSQKMKRELSINWGKVLNSSVTTEMKTARCHLTCWTTEQRASTSYRWVQNLSKPPLKTTWNSLPFPKKQFHFETWRSKEIPMD